MSRAIILAAGQGTRLRPLTDDKPKCLVLLLGKSLLERQIDTLIKSGVDNIQIATGYRADKIEVLGLRTSFNAHFAETNMVESLFSAMDFIKQEGDLIIAYGDIVYNQENLETLLACDDEIALMIDEKWLDLWGLRLENPLEDAETLMMDDDGYVTELGKKPESYEQIQGQYTGLIKIRADKINEFLKFYENLDNTAKYDGKDFDNMYMTSFLQLFINAGWIIMPAHVSHGWLEVDTVEDLQLYERLSTEEKLNALWRAHE